MVKLINVMRGLSQQDLSTRPFSKTSQQDLSARPLRYGRRLVHFFYFFKDIYSRENSARHMVKKIVPLTL